MINRSKLCEEYEALKKRVWQAFSAYDIYNCMTARNYVKKVLKENLRLREEFSWLEKELGVELN